MASLKYFILPATLASFALARTDLTGCTSTDVSSPAGASVAWYVPGTGELCDFLDCGGGTAPPITTVPGCPLYSGTSTYSPSYMPGYGSATAAASSSWSEASQTMAASSSVDWSAMETDSATSSWNLYTNTALLTGGSTWASASGGSWSSAWASASSTWSSGTASPLICAIGSCSPVSTSTWTYAASTSMVTTTSAAGVAANGTSAGAGSTGGVSGAAGNGTAYSAGATATASPSSTQGATNGGEGVRVWMGAGLVVGLGAVVAVL